MQNTCQPYLIKDYDTLPVGFFSLVTEEFPFVTSGGDVQMQGDNLTVARNMVATLRQKGAEIIVAITHIGAKLDRHLAEFRAVPRLACHHHVWYFRCGCSIF